MGGAMTSKHTPAPRMVRASVFALVCVLLSAIGHAAASGHILSPSTMLLALAGVAGGAWVFAARQVGLCAIGIGLPATQGVLHMWYSVTPSPNGRGVVHVSASDLPATPAMVGAHGLAALVCAVWLWRGERAFFTLLSLFCAWTFAPLFFRAGVRFQSVGPSVSLCPTGRDRVPLRSGDLLRHSLGRRGPPRLRIRSQSSSSADGAHRTYHFARTRWCALSTDAVSGRHPAASAP